MSSDSSRIVKAQDPLKPGSAAEAKQQAKLLRNRLSADDMDISHSKSLELIAQQYGFRDWNTLFASYGNRQERQWHLGDRVTGRYLTQSFAGEIIAVQSLRDGMQRITFRFDEPVDVVTFESFSAFRQRVTKVIGSDGMTIEKTSDGRPHMVLNL